jgi:hypothetical protein
MDDWLEVGVFHEGQPYLQKYRIRSGKQTITVTVPQKPARAGIDPRHLLSCSENGTKKSQRDPRCCDLCFNSSRLQSLPAAFHPQAARSTRFGRRRDR